MARNDDRARARRNKRRGEDDSSADQAAEPTAAASNEDTSDDASALTDTQRAENASRLGTGMGLTGAVGVPGGLGMSEQEYDDASDFVPDAGGAVVGGEVSTTSGQRVLRFFRASWAELQRVIWPNRQQVAQGTAVTLGFVIIAGIYLGIADTVARVIVNWII